MQEPESGQSISVKLTPEARLVAPHRRRPWPSSKGTLGRCRSRTKPYHELRAEAGRPLPEFVQQEFAAECARVTGVPRAAAAQHARAAVGRGCWSPHPGRRLHTPVPFTLTGYGNLEGQEVVHRDDQCRWLGMGDDADDRQIAIKTGIVPMRASAIIAVGCFALSFGAAKPSSAQDLEVMSCRWLAGR